MDGAMLSQPTKLKTYTPGGAQTLSKMSERFPESFPKTLFRGHGAHVWDDHDDQFVDWICALGAITLGYQDTRVDHAVRRQIGAGPLFSLPSPLEWEVAETFCHLIPCAEMVRFTKTGSEASEGAIRIARAVTKRDHIISIGYHSWHSWYAATQANHPGVPKAMEGLASACAYNDLESLGKMMLGDVAAVIMEPRNLVTPEPSYLQAVQDMCRANGSLLIFDEMLTGFRWSKRGYQAVAGVYPDLAIFGKGMGNGYPIAAVCGRADLMDPWGKLVSGTFGGDCIGLAAAGAVMQAYEERNVPEIMAGRGRALMERYPEYLLGSPYRMKWTFTGMDNHVFIQETAKRGVLFHPGGFNVNAALTDEDMMTTFDAVDGSLDALARGVKLRGRMPTEHPFRVTY